MCVLHFHPESVQGWLRLTPPGSLKGSGHVQQRDLLTWGATECRAVGWREGSCWSSEAERVQKTSSRSKTKSEEEETQKPKSAFLGSQCRPLGPAEYHVFPLFV